MSDDPVDQLNRYLAGGGTAAAPAPGEWSPRQDQDAVSQLNRYLSGENQPSQPPAPPSFAGAAQATGPYRGQIFPFSVDQGGNARVDWNAGLPGMAGGLA